MLNGHMVQHGLTLIGFSLDHNLNEQLCEGACLANLCVQWIGKQKCKVKTRETVITELGEFSFQCGGVTLGIPECEGVPSEQDNNEPPAKRACCGFTLG